MSFWSKLAKGAAIAAPIVAAPFTGGASLTSLPGILSAGAGALGTIGRVGGDAAKGVQGNRHLENQIQQGADRNRLNRAGLDIDQRQSRDRMAMERAALLERMGMDRAKLGIEAPMARTKQAAYGDALKNVQDVNIDFNATTGAMPKFNVSGGIRPSMFGENARAAGGELGRQALMALMSGSDVPAMTDVPEASDLVELPEMSDPKGSGALEKGLGVAGIGGTILGGLGEMLKKRQVPTLQSGRISGMPISGPMV